MSEKRKVGRPPTFRKKDIPELKEKVDLWLKAHKARVPLYADKDQTIMLDEAGNPAYRTVWISKPTEYALCHEVFGCTSETWRVYCDPEKHPEFKEFVAYVKDQMKDFLFMDGMAARSSSMHQFILQNNYGMRSKSELEIGRETRDAAKEAITGLANRVAFLQAVASEDGEEEE